MAGAGGACESSLVESWSCLWVDRGRLYAGVAGRRRRDGLGAVAERRSRWGRTHRCGAGRRWWFSDVCPRRGRGGLLLGIVHLRHVRRPSGSVVRTPRDATGASRGAGCDESHRLSAWAWHARRSWVRVRGRPARASRTRAPCLRAPWRRRRATSVWWAGDSDTAVLVAVRRRGRV